jgi:hypothetical protein
MIKQVLKMLMALDHYGQSDLIEIAKGKNELPETWSKAKRQIKRICKRK